jgi:Leucine Rich repeat
VDRALSWLLALVLAPTAGCHCGRDEADDNGSSGEQAPREPVAADPPSALPSPRTLVIHHGAELDVIDLAELETLDLALAESDRIGRLTEIDASSACAGIDLGSVATRAPKLRALRVSGCADATASLAALVTLERLELNEVTIDRVLVERLGALVGLRTLTLARTPATEALVLDSLAALHISELALVELDRDSALAGLLALWPTSLQRVTLAGAWAGHDAMTRLSKAVALERLELRDTRVGNFSLNQIKPLLRLREVIWSGDTFNDNSPLYFRALPVERFACACPRFGDNGLHTLRHCEHVERLELERTQVTGAGLTALARLPRLAELVLHDRELGEAGFAALATVTHLRRLELSGHTEDPRVTGIGGLIGLEQLRLHYPELDDRAMTEIGKLIRLRELDLGGTALSDVGLAALAGLGGLEALTLSSTRVTNRGLAHLATLAHLQRLELDHTDVVDAGVHHLIGLQELVSLRLDHTLVTDAAVDDLLALGKLARLDLRATVVTAEGAARLSSAPTLVELAWGDQP